MKAETLQQVDGVNCRDSAIRSRLGKLLNDMLCVLNEAHSALLDE